MITAWLFNLLCVHCAEAPLLVRRNRLFFFFFHFHISVSKASSSTPAASPQPIIPQELIDIIIDYLSNDTCSLRACALVSPSWTHRSQQNLFARITFTDGLWPTSAELFLRLIESAPHRHLPKFVQHLDIIEGDTFMSNRWLARCIPVLDRIFPALVNLRTLQIKFHGLLWRNIAGIRSSFLSASKLPDLHQVTISGIYSVPSLDTLFTLFEGSNIADIRLMNVTTGGSLKDSPRTRTHHVPGSVAPIPLETLSLSLENKELWRLSSWLADPSCVLHLSGLRKLRLNIVVAQEMKAVCRLLKTLQIPSLEAIEIQLETFDYVSDPEDIPDLSRFRHVRLTVTPEYVSGSGMYELDVEIASFVAFCWSQMLSGFRENAIESVALLLPKAAQRVRCTALDAALTRADMSHLRRVYLEDETATEYRDEVIKDILPNLYEKGLLG